MSEHKVYSRGSRLRLVAENNCALPNWKIVLTECLSLIIFPQLQISHGMNEYSYNCTFVLLTLFSFVVSELLRYIHLKYCFPSFSRSRTRSLCL